MYLTYVILISVYLEYFYESSVCNWIIAVYTSFLLMIESIQLPGSIRNLMNGKSTYQDFVNIMEFIGYIVYIYITISMGI